MTKFEGDRPSLCVVIDSHRIDTKSDHLRGLVRGIVNETDQLPVQSHILVPMQTRYHKNPDDVRALLKKEFPGQASTVLLESDLGSAYVYTKGLQEGAKIARERSTGAAGSMVVEIDIGGAHDPRQIGRFVNGLENNDVVFSSRFIKGNKAYHPDGQPPYPDGVDGYPLQRQILSRGVTALSSLLLGTKGLTDAASGYQGFRADVVDDLFRIAPPDTWFSVVRGPMHMVQTELRAYVIALVRQRNYSWVQVPIEYGTKNVAKRLNNDYVLDALKTFVSILKVLPTIKQRVKDLPTK